MLSLCEIFLVSSRQSYSCLYTSNMYCHHDASNCRPGATASKNNKFAQSLFESEFSENVRDAVLRTKFFQKMINNTLQPEEYGGYMVQDAAYVYDAINAFQIAAEKSQANDSLPRDFALFYRGMAESFTNYYSYFSLKWKLRNSKSVIMGPAAATYVAFEMKLARTNAKFLSIGILPCDMLWPLVARQLNDLVDKSNVYRSWVDDNHTEKGSSSSTQDFVKKYFTEDDRVISEEIFNEGMINELNFFLSACDEDPVDYNFGYISPRA